MRSGGLTHLAVLLFAVVFVGCGSSHDPGDAGDDTGADAGSEQPSTR